MLAFKALQGNEMNQSPAELLEFSQMVKTEDTPVVLVSIRLSRKWAEKRHSYLRVAGPNRPP
jgi:hypothetical protein